MEDSEDPAADAARLLFCWWWSRALIGNGSLALNLRDEFRSCNIQIAIREHLQATWVKVAERTTNNQILFNLPEVKERLLATGTEASGTTPEEFAAYIKSETVKWAKVVKAAGIVLE